MFISLRSAHHELRPQFYSTIIKYDWTDQLMHCKGQDGNV